MNNIKILFMFLVAFGLFYEINKTTQLPSATGVKTNISTPDIKETIVAYREYPKVIELLNQWKQAAPQLVSTGKLEGKTAKGTDICYVKVTNQLNNKSKDKILIHACIHANEVLANTVCLSYIATLLSEYGKDKDSTTIIDNYDLYFIPVFSPDSFPNNRYTEGVDPNRNFPRYDNPDTKSVPTVKSVANFFLKHKFKAVISMHTFGRVFLTPFGYSWNKCPDEAKFKSIFSEMAKLSGYQWKHAVELYSRPIQGSEVDFYYKNGAISAVMELGTHQRIPTLQDTKFEFDKTYKSIKYFILNSTK